MRDVLEMQDEIKKQKEIDAILEEIYETKEYLEIWNISVTNLCTFARDVAHTNIYGVSEFNHVRNKIEHELSKKRCRLAEVRGE